MKRIIIPAAILTIFSLAQLQAKDKQQGACQADMEKLCGNHKGDRQAMKACLQQNKDNFSAECKAQREKFRAGKAERNAKRAKVMEVCANDVQKLCPQANQPGAKKNASFHCLRLNREKLSPGCQAALPEKKAPHPR